jgi:hypothetical protein
MGNTERTSITLMEVVKNVYMVFKRKPLIGLKLILQKILNTTQ